MPTMICQKWEESENEPGWGVTVRSDGFSLHSTEADRVAFIKEYWDKMPKGPAPSCYSRPDGEPYFVQLEVMDELHLELIKSKNGIRRFDKAPKGFREVN